jgi:hypothetical protein
MRTGVIARAAFLMLAILAAGCDETPTSPGAPLNLVRLAGADGALTYTSGLATPQRLVVRDQGAWQQTWASIWRNVSPQPPLPAIDFTREMVIVAALGQRPTGGFSIIISEARADGAATLVTVRSIAPGAGCGVTLAITTPVDVARVTRRDGQVGFSEVSEVNECR